MLYCSACGLQNESSAQFCSNCGASITQEGPAKGMETIFIFQTYLLLFFKIPSRKGIS